MFYFSYTLSPVSFTLLKFKMCYFFLSSKPLNRMTRERNREENVCYFLNYVSNHTQTNIVISTTIRRFTFVCGIFAFSYFVYERLNCNCVKMKENERKEKEKQSSFRLNCSSKTTSRMMRTRQSKA